MIYKYFFYAIALISFIWKGSTLIKAIKEKNSSKTKAELFLLILMIIVVIGVALLEKNYST